jgi:23S rRNA (uracil1939-C5)-methyltransferase
VPADPRRSKGDRPSRTDIRPGGFAPRRRSNPRQVVDDEALVVRPEGPEYPEPAPPIGALKLALGEITEVTVEKLVAGGEGLGRHEGVPIFVPRSAPGDRLRVRLVERHGDYGRAEILDVLTPGPGRRLPPCPHFDRCGGCDLQHLEDALQSKLKAAAVLETVVRMGKVEVPANLKVVTGASWGYRLRAQLHTARPENPGELPRVGYFARGSRELVAVETCPILVPELEAMLPQLPSLLGAAPGDLPHRLDLAAGEGGEISTAPVAGTLPHGPIALDAGGFRYAFDARTFFQGHRGLVNDLVAAALGPAEWTGELAVDLYAGVGLFSLPLATRYRRVLAIEGDRVAARYARTNVKARPEGSTGAIKVIDQAVESWITDLPEGVDRVIADPPRTGLKGPVVRALLERRPRRVTYVSCHPATFARDLRALGKAYELEGLTLIDLFPQTGHMELVAQLALTPSIPLSLAAPEPAPGRGGGRN